MQNNECLQYEAALLNGETLSPELAAHMAQCPECKALAEVAALSIAPVTAAEPDLFTQTIHKLATEQAQQRAARFERQRVRMPLLIGLIGYALAGISLLTAYLSRPTGHMPIPQFSLPALEIAVPPPTPAFVIGILCVAIIWIVGLMIYVRRGEHAAPPLRKED
jgi:hypothetical protein